jgi:serine/threonine protein kinase
VLDFGISKVMGDNHALTMTSSFVGTPAHASPEQVLGMKDIDARSDQYSLGVVLYACITGTLPFDPDAPLFELMRAVSEGNYPRPAAMRADLPPEFEAIVLRSMARDRDHRYPTLDDLRLALAPFAMHSVSSELPAAETDPGEEVATEVQVPSSSGIRGAPPRMAIAQTLTPSQASFPTPLPSHYAGVSTPAPVGYTPSGLHVPHVSVPPSYTPSAPPGMYSSAYSQQPPAGSNRLVVLLLAALLLAVLGVGGGVVTVLLLSGGSNETVAPSDGVASPSPTMTETVVAQDEVEAGGDEGTMQEAELAMDEAPDVAMAEAEAALDEAAEDGEEESNDRDRRRRRRRQSMNDAMEDLMVETQMVVVPQQGGGTDIRDPWGN